MKEKDKQKLIDLYQQMADLTLPACKTCRVPLSYCSPEYCQMAKTYAKEVWKIDLIESFKDSKLPFMSATGCIIPPYLRPLCTLHTCDINSLGFKKNDPEWTKKYFKLRAKIETIESKTYYGSRQ